MANLFETLQSLEECKCSGDDKKCKCKKGDKCDGKCSCKTSKIDDNQYNSQWVKPVKEAKQSDEEGDAKMHAKKDDALGDKCPKCGSTKGYVAGKCLSCKCPMKESKFDSYILECEEADLQEKEDQLMEGTIVGDLRKELLAAGLGVGIPSSGLTVDAYKGILSKLQSKGLTDLAGKLKAGITWSKVEQDNMNKFK